MFGDSDLGVFFADMGVPVVWNDEPAAIGILEQWTDAFAHGSGPGKFQRNTLILRIPYNAFSATPQPCDAVTVMAGPYAGSYTVLEMPDNHDPQVTEVYLKSAGS
jgi:hypothetical protein